MIKDIDVASIHGNEQFSNIQELGEKIVVSIFDICRSQVKIRWHYRDIVFTSLLEDYCSDLIWSNWNQLSRIDDSANSYQIHKVLCNRHQLLELEQSACLSHDIHQVENFVFLVVVKLVDGVFVARFNLLILLVVLC